MYLYKATCPDIPNPKQKGVRSQAGFPVPGPVHGRLVRRTSATTGPQPYVPHMLWTPSKQNNVAAEVKQLEEFLNFHSLTLQDTVKSRTGMVYR